MKEIGERDLIVRCFVERVDDFELRDQREARGELDESRMYALFFETLLTFEIFRRSLEIQWLCGRSKIEIGCKSEMIFSRRCRLRVTHPIVCFWVDRRWSILFKRMEMIFVVHVRWWMEKSVSDSLQLKLLTKSKTTYLPNLSILPRSHLRSSFSSLLFSSFPLFADSKSLSWKEGHPSFFFCRRS